MVAGRTLLLWTGILACAESALHPVVLVPGLSGSVMRMKLDGGPRPHLVCEGTADWFTAWLNLEEIGPVVKDCLLARLMLTFDPATGRYANAAGVTVDSNVDFGGLGGISYLDPALHTPNYFGTMADYLQTELNYTAGRDLHGAPYDWRLAPDGHAADGQYYAKLTALVESTVAKNGLPAHLISHSLGGPTLMVWLGRQSAQWKAKHIKSFIPVAPPLQGATSQLRASISGDNFGLPVPSDYLYPVQASAPSGVFLWPTERAFGSEPYVFTPSTNYTVSQLVQMNMRLNNSRAVQAYRNLDATGLSLPQLEPPGVTVHVVYSYGVKMGEKFHFQKELNGRFDHSAPSRIEYGDGDGSVNVKSVLWAKEAWAGEPNISFWNVSGVSHFGTVSDRRVLAYIKSLIQV